MPENTKLVEVALPLRSINQSSIREKSIRHGHPSTLHIWWARRPLAACRAALLASLIDDPSVHPEEFPTEESQNQERERLFRLISEAADWDNTNNESLISNLKNEIAKSTNGMQNSDQFHENFPKLLDPFSGGGTIPLEASRFGLQSFSGDLNPIGVLMTKCLVEYPSLFSDSPPANPEVRKQENIGETDNTGTESIANDIRYYGDWIEDQVSKEISHIYPNYEICEKLADGRDDLSDRVGEELTVISWLWARKVPCPNPACGGFVPTVKTYWLSKKNGNKAWLDPDINNERYQIDWHVREGSPPEEKTGEVENGTRYVTEDGSKPNATFECPFCDNGVADGEYVNSQADGGLNTEPLAVVADGDPGRVYLPFNERQVRAASEFVDQEFSERNVSEILPKEPCRGTFAGNAQGRTYGFDVFSDYFTKRQQVGHSVFIKYLKKLSDKVEEDAIEAGFDANGGSIRQRNSGAKAYSEAITTYMSMGFSRLLNRGSTICMWNRHGEKIEQTFARQGIAMMWDFAESNPFSGSTGDWRGSLEWVPKVVENLPSSPHAEVEKTDARSLPGLDGNWFVFTDPPYYDNISYSDLADFFYVWLKQVLSDIYPELMDTILTPKQDELIASSDRFDNKQDARDFFEEGLRDVFSRLYELSDPDYPMCLFYAFKQQDIQGDDGNQSSTGWQTMLSALIDSGFQITGTWPIRTERSEGLKSGSNVLASSILLTCRPRSNDSDACTRREFIQEIKQELPESISTLQESNIAPVDLTQASIGPGMAVYSRYSEVLEADGTPMSVRTALEIINAELDSYLTMEEGKMDRETQFAVTWFEQHGMDKGDYGEAEVLFTAKDISADQVVNSGIAEVQGGKVRLQSRGDLDEEIDSLDTSDLTVWECTQFLIRTLETEGEEKAAEFISDLPSGMAEDTRDLSYRLYSISARKDWSDEALSYNNLVVEWPRLQEMAYKISSDDSGPLDQFLNQTDEDN